MHYPNDLPTIKTRESLPLSRRIGLGVSACLGALLFTAMLYAFFGGAGTARAIPQQTANVIVQFDDSARLVREIAFTDPISGIKALELAGLSVAISDTSFGPLVCGIEGVGCPSEDCFCGGSSYWGYNYHDGSSWQGYSVGAGSSVITQTGAIEGWRWGEFGSSLGDPAASLASAAALDWISARQSITAGGFGSASAGVEVLLAFGSNRQNADTIHRSAEAPTLRDFMALNSATYSRTSAGASGKLAAALVAGNACLPIDVATPSTYFNPTVGAYGAGTGDNAWAILGATALSETVPAEALTTLRAAQQADGGWEWSPGWGSDTNSTALAVQALIANGESITSTAILSAVTWFKSVQSADGGFPYSEGDTATSDANSTAYVIQALVAAGEDVTGIEWTQDDNSPVSYLLGMQLPSGAFEWTPGTGENALATTQAIPALLGRAHPLVDMESRGELALCPATFLPVIQLGGASASAQLVK